MFPGNIHLQPQQFRQMAVAHPAVADQSTLRAEFDQ
jgi:hypothetical protein